MAGFGASHTEFRCAQLVLIRQGVIDGIENIILAHALGLQLFHTGQKVTGVLIRRLTAAPWITARVTLGAVMLQNITITVIHTKVVSQVSLNRIHFSTLPFSTLQ